MLFESPTRETRGNLCPGAMRFEDSVGCDLRRDFVDIGGSEELLDFEPLLASPDGFNRATHPLGQKIFFLRVRDGSRYVSFSIEGRWLKMNDEALMPVIFAPEPFAPHQYRLLNACQGEGRWLALDKESGKLHAACDARDDALLLEVVDSSEQTVRLKSRQSKRQGWICLTPADHHGVSRLQLTDREHDGLRVCLVPGPQDNLTRWHSFVSIGAGFGGHKVFRIKQRERSPVPNRT